MCKIKKFVEIAQTKNLFAFHTLINKEGEHFYDYLISRFEENDICYNLYFLLIYNLWFENNSSIKNFNSIDSYIHSSISKFSEKAKFLSLEKIPDFPSLYDTTQKKNIIKKRKINYMNERIINHIILNEFKNELNIKDCFYEVVTNTVNSRRTDIRNLSGSIFTKSKDSHAIYYVFIITINSIFMKKLDIEYNNVSSEQGYDEFNFSDLKFISFVGPKGYKVLNKFMVLTFNHFDDLIIPQSKSIHMYSLKRALILLLDSKNVPIKHLEAKNNIKHIV
ncbi:MAG: hypothetical protein ACRC57_05365 [Sarcina sp.]